MRKTNIGFDLDGVICDTYSGAFKVLKEMYPKQVTKDNFDSKWENSFNLTVSQVTNCFVECARRGIFRELKYYQDAKQALERLSRHYRIFIVTWRNYLPNAMSDTLYWLDSNRIPYYRVVMTKNKFKVAAREDFKFFIDDNVNMCNRVAKTTMVPTFLFRRPWNINDVTDPLVKTMNSWEEIERMLSF